MADPARWEGSFEDARRRHLTDGLRATPAQRLAWLEEALRLAHDSGALERRARAVSLRGLPGGDIVAAGLEDLAAGRETEAALLVSIGAPRLRQAGLEVPSSLDDAEHRLYLWLSREEPDTAHSRYNALVSRLVSFERALASAT